MNAATIFMLFLCLQKLIAAKCPAKCHTNKSEFHSFDSATNADISINKCESIVIFDLSKNVITKEIFDVSIKIFLKLIFEHCNNFKYVVMNSDCKNCSIVINECNDELSRCENIIDNMDYNNVSMSYSTDLFDDSPDDLKNYVAFLEEVFTEICPCNDNSVLLLTNRILYLPSDQNLTQIIEDSCIKITVILLGRPDAAVYLQAAYRYVPNVTTLSFPNYDCLNYLFYCLLPCSNIKLECSKIDINDCQAKSKWTPNDNPKETFHAWYVLDFGYFPTNSSADLQINEVMSNMGNGLREFTAANNITRVRIQVVYKATDITSPSFENIDTFPSGIPTQLMELSGDVADDRNEFNDRLTFIPWSKSLTETRVGILAVIILTNYATPSLKTIINDENLQGWMYVYNPLSYKYYSGVLKNSTNFHYSPLNYSDSINIYTIQNDSFEAIVSSSTTKTTSIFHRTKTTTLFSKLTRKSITSTQPSYHDKPSSNNAITIIISVSVCGCITIVVITFCIYWKRKQRKIRQTNHKDIPELLQPTPDEWELQWNKLVLQKEIGSGAYGQILLGKLCRENQIEEDDLEVAIKIPCKFATDLAKTHFFNEINLMKKIGEHTNIIKMYGCITVGNRICLVLEYCSNMDLLNFVKNLKNHLIEENKMEIKQEFFEFLWQISHGLQYLVSHGIIHRDLAARNILIDSKKHAKITDFGLSLQLRGRTTITAIRESEKLPIKWLAIESLEKYKFSFKSDIWTFGIVLFEMYSFGETPYSNIQASSFLKYLKSGKRLAQPDFLPSEIFEIMLTCWLENPFRRPTINELIANFSKIRQ